jgi:hypothetical protein
MKNYWDVAKKTRDGFVLPLVSFALSFIFSDQNGGLILLDYKASRIGWGSKT